MIEKQTLKFASFWLYWPAKVFPIVILQNIYQTPSPSLTAVSDINDNINNKNDNTALLIGLSVSLVLVLILLVIVILLLVGYNKRWEKRSDFNNGEFTSIWFYENVLYFFLQKTVGVSRIWRTRFSAIRRYIEHKLFKLIFK